MQMRLDKLKWLLLLGLIILGVIAALKGKSDRQTNQISSMPSPQSSEETNQAPRIVKTKPEPLEEAIISATEVIEITFNKPLENAPELKTRMDPKNDYQIELSSDRKTAKIIPLKPYELGLTYTLFIQADSKFDGGGRLDREKVFHVHTVRYRGI